jgi:hypothetical protein
MAHMPVAPDGASGGRRSGQRHPTEYVDNFVKKCLDTRCQPASMRLGNKTMTNEAVKNSIESTTCNAAPWVAAGCFRFLDFVGGVWSSAPQHGVPARIVIDDGF